MDRYTLGTVERISPEAPVPIVAVEEEKYKLGLAANVADNIKVLGGVPFLCGIVGHDRAADDFKDLLKSSGISSQHLVTDKSRRTVLKERIVSERQQLLRVDYENTHPMNGDVEKNIRKKITQLLTGADAVILEDYAKGLFNEDFTHEVLSLIRKSKKMSLVDPNSKTPVSRYKGASLLTPNKKEAEALTGISIQDESSLWNAGRKLLDLTGAEYAVITRGKEGMAIFMDHDPCCLLINTCAREVYDVSGAGDTVIAVLALALSAGARITDAAILGNLAAGVEVGKRGTATVSTEEVRVAMEFFGESRV